MVRVAAAVLVAALVPAASARPLQPPPAPVLTKVGNFGLVTDIDAPPGDDHRTMVVEQRGVIQLLVDGVRSPVPFLDLTDRVVVNGEAGLLSVAFAPDYASSGRLYVFYNGADGNINIVEFTRDATDPDRVDPASARTLLRQVKFAPNHNGGMLQFGPDTYLYASIGDGGSSADVRPGQFAQSPTSVFGKILRIEPASATYTIHATGLRNPWRFWIDFVSGDTLVADVGQELREEIDVIPAPDSGLDFGWPCFEGTLAFDAGETCAQPVRPIYEYAHGEGACSITGGVVARDPRLPALTGAFLFGDFCGAELRSLRRNGAEVTVADLGVRARSPVAFGEDGLFRIHVATVDGALYRLDPAP